ncbi:MAG: hypothetical protein IJU20_02370 [Clostridia bacterium]|nr:hypothetical protein [Clostridia bacterium]
MTMIRKNGFLKTAIVWVLLLAMLFSMAACGFAREASNEPGTVKFSEMQYELVEESQVQEKIEALRQAGEGSNYKKFSKIYEEYNDYFAHVMTMSTLANLKYNEDVSDDTYSKESELMDEYTSDMIVAYYQICYKVLTDSPMSEKFKKDLTEEDIQDIMEGYKTYTDEYMALRDAADKIAHEEQNLQATLTLTFEGAEYTMDELVDQYYKGKMTYDRIMQYQDEYYVKLCEESGKLYLKLMPLYKQMAELAGFNSVAELQYKDLGRDYTPKEAEQYWAFVKSYVCPLYQSITLLSSEEQKLQQIWESKSALLNKLQTPMEEYFASISPKMLEAYNYMNEYELISSGYSTKRYPGSFTTRLMEYNEPYVFLNVSTKGYDYIGTLIHEFGHFFAFYLGGYEATQVLDINEIQSQANELLFLDVIKNNYSEKEYNVLLKMQLGNMLYSIIDAARQDEFQQKAFAQENPTYESLCELYQSIDNSYGLPKESVVPAGAYWALYPHHFATPFYYISYGMSAISALDIFAISASDRQLGIDTYMKVARVPAEVDYLEMLNDYGMHSPFEESLYKELSDTFKALLG